MFWYSIYIKYLEGNQKFLPYQHMIIKFINKYNKLYKDSTIQEAVMYSKYYLNYKMFQCTYDEHIMSIILHVEAN